MPLTGGGERGVCDGGGTGTPRVRQRADLAEGGRGLLVVDTLAASWGNAAALGNVIPWR